MLRYLSTYRDPRKKRISDFDTWSRVHQHTSSSVFILSYSIGIAVLAMSRKKRQKVDNSTFHFDLEEILPPTPSSAPQFSVESFSADGRRVRKEVHIAEPPSPLKRATTSRPALVPQENTSNQTDPWIAYDFGIDEHVVQVPAHSKKKKRYLSSVS